MFDWLYWAGWLWPRMHDRIVQLTAQVERLEKEVAAKKWRHYCAYCGLWKSKEQLSFDEGSRELRAHIEVCEKHPLAEALGLLREARGEVERLQALLDDKEDRQRESVT